MIFLITQMHPICLMQRLDRLTTVYLSHWPCAASASILLKILLIGASRVKCFVEFTKSVVTGSPW